MTITLMSFDSEVTVHFSGLHQDIMVFRDAERKVEIIQTQGFWIGLTDNIAGMN